jgi:hypothetical protein
MIFRVEELSRAQAERIAATYGEYLLEILARTAGPLYWAVKGSK